MSRLALVIIVLTSLADLAGGQPIEAEEYALENGMTFLLLSRQQEPGSVSCGWITKVGSVDQCPGFTGAGQFVDRMMLGGTLPSGARDEALEDTLDNALGRRYAQAGATGLHADTCPDWTAFSVTVPSDRIELWARVESERLADPRLAEFDAEREAVFEERRAQLDSSPTGRLDRQFDAMFWQSTPYAWSVLGRLTDAQPCSREQLEAYFDIHYRPDDLVGVLVGDFDPQTTRSLLREHFGRLERGEQKPRPPVTVPTPQAAEMRLHGECDCQPQVEVRYHTVPFDHPDSFALEIMAGVLNGRTGRLYRSMVEDSTIATSAEARQDSRRYAGAFAFTGEVKGETAPEDLEKAWYDQLQRLRTEPVPDDELQRVKDRIVAETARRLQRNDRLFFAVAICEVVGGWEYLNDAPKKLMAVDADDLLRVAQTYFDETNRCVAIYTTRRAGGEEPGKDPLADLPQPLRGQFEQTLQRLLAYGPDDLRRVIPPLEQAALEAPERVRVAIEYMLEKLRKRLDELEGRDEVEDKR